MSLWMTRRAPWILPIGISVVCTALLWIMLLFASFDGSPETQILLAGPVVLVDLLLIGASASLLVARASRPGPDAASVRGETIAVAAAMALAVPLSSAEIALGLAPIFFVSTTAFLRGLWKTTRTSMKHGRSNATTRVIVSALGAISLVSGALIAFVRW